MSNIKKDDIRQLAAFVSDSLAKEYELGYVLVLTINEDPDRPCHLQLDASGDCHTAYTQEGGERIIRIAERLQVMISALAAEMAAEMQCIIVDRPDLAIQVPGERPKA